MYAYAYVFFTSPLDLIIFESFWKEGLYKKIKMFVYINKHRYNEPFTIVASRFFCQLH